TELKYFPDFGATNFPPMKRSYLSLMRGSAVSGAGSYFQRSPKISSGIGAFPVRGTGRVDVISVALRRFGVVVRRLIRAGLFLVYRPHQIVEQRAGAEAVARIVEPRVAERFLDGDEKMERQLRRADSAGRLHSDRLACGEVVIAYRLEHHLVVGERRAA